MNIMLDILYFLAVIGALVIVIILWCSWLAIREDDKSRPCHRQHLP
jgi:hypothetical protein